MKKFFFATLLASVFVNAGQIAFTEVILTKNSKDLNGLELLAAPVKKWCAKSNYVIQIESFDVALKLEALAEGTHLCKGQFVNYKYRSPVQVFALSECSIINEREYFAENCQN